ncbi:peptide-methionine (S)-S-oxide reductase MsrA [Arachidicoccus soli]|uniref:Peptide methionine sulfoxide reductase MsrA n=1 Tax=Arachidicoccus soli TaxID=2341117 RepID=A0A386HQ44_9BACT|nr:peptide-methionine (S)-S-oxide reductase MsrA [Arachidicoccus soli]AYD48068.1 peptide-methionine (S)-S-oxide reductase [Arachidicoccus soli]
MKKIISFLLVTMVISTAIFASSNKSNTGHTTYTKLDTATFALGCFWCTEAKFKELQGVVKVTSGFSGGHTVNPTYEEVCTGTTGHAEACNIIYDPKQISYAELLQVFFTTHDPTQLNRQGNDIGTQYRSAIFYHNAAQKQASEYYIKRLNQEKAYPRPIVTQVVPFTVFYKAEGYHQDYFSRNGNQPYCKYVIQPELDKFRKAFASKLKTQYK